MQFTELSSKPSTFKQYMAALTAKANRNTTQLPEIGMILRNQIADPSDIAHYNEVCGFKAGSTLPITYLHMLAAPLHMQVMTSPSFPFKLLGLVHVRNLINQHRPIANDECLDISCRTGNLYATDKGMESELITEVKVGEELVWDSVSTMLSRGFVPANVAPSPDKEDLYIQGYTSETWNIASNIGRRYAKVSGDSNPIHLYPITAKMFGFTRHIAHGMWTKAKALAEMDSKHHCFTAKAAVEVQFKTPIHLPAKVCFSHTGNNPTYSFKVSDKNDEKPHLVGRIVTS